MKMAEPPRNQNELDAQLHEMRLTVLTSHIKKLGAEVTVDEVRNLLNLNQSDRDIILTIRQRQSFLFKFRTSRFGRIIGMKS